KPVHLDELAEAMSRCTPRAASLPETPQPALAPAHEDGVLDTKVLEQLSATVGDRAFVVELVETFLREAPALLETVRGALEAAEDRISRSGLARELEREGHGVTTVADGVRALEALRAEPFDVVLLDVLMPELDGYETLAQIERDEKLRHVPVIMVSALEDVESVVRCIEMGAADYLPKPFDPVLLRARINGC